MWVRVDQNKRWPLNELNRFKVDGTGHVTRPHSAHWRARARSDRFPPKSKVVERANSRRLTQNLSEFHDWFICQIINKSSALKLRPVWLKFQIPAAAFRRFATQRFVQSRRTQTRNCSPFKELSNHIQRIKIPSEFQPRNIFYKSRHPAVQAPDNEVIERRSNSTST